VTTYYTTGVNIKGFSCLFEVYLTTLSTGQIIESHYMMYADTPRLRQSQVMQFQDYAVLKKQKLK
jgi:hypothetical protein